MNGQEAPNITKGLASSIKPCKGRPLYFSSYLVAYSNILTKSHGYESYLDDPSYVVGIDVMLQCPFG